MIILYLCFGPQGRVDALWALLRRQYDRVSVMRPTSAEKVSLKHWNLQISSVWTLGNQAGTFRQRDYIDMSGGDMN